VDRLCKFGGGTFTDSASAPTDFSGESFAAFVDSGEHYSLFTQLIITFSGAGSVSFNNDLTMSATAPQSVPEPGSLALIRHHSRVRVVAPQNLSGPAVETTR
jgi:hypothetical protein